MEKIKMTSELLFELAFIRADKQGLFDKPISSIKFSYILLENARTILNKYNKDFHRNRKLVTKYFVKNKKV